MIEREEIVIGDFGKGWDIRQYPPNTVRDRAVGAMMPHLSGVKVERDATLKWIRNQFRISSPVSAPRLLYEFVTDTYNQLLALCADGNLYKLDRVAPLVLDWSTETPTQWAYGYELFASDDWADTAADLPATPPWGVAMTQDILMLSHKTVTTKYWNGTALVEIGLTPPTAACVGTLSPFAFTDEDFTAYTESDTGTYLTVIAGRITAVAIPQTGDSRVYADFGTRPLSDFTHTFDVRLTAADVNAKMAVWGVSTIGDSYIVNWSGFDFIFVALSAKVGPVYHLTIDSRQEGTAVGDEIAIALATTYYCTVRKIGTSATLYVYSDSDRLTLLGEITVAVAYAGSYSYVYGFVGWGASAGAEAMSGYVENLNLGVSGTAEGSLVTGTYSYCYTYGNATFESMPSPIVDVTVGAEGYEIDLTGITVDAGGDATWRRLYRAYTSSTEPGARGTSFQRHLAGGELEDNTTTIYTDSALQSTLGDEIEYDDNARPPWGDILCRHNERIFMAGVAKTSDSYSEVETTGLDNKLFYSNIGEAYQWPGDNWIEVGDKTAIVGLASLGNLLVIIKESSVFTLASYGDTFVITQIDAQFGATNPASITSSPQGVVWTSPQGLVLYGAAGLRLLLEAKSDQPFAMPSTSYPWLAYHQGYLYFLPTGGRLLRWDSMRDVWEMYPHEVTAETVGIRAFNKSEYQSHVLAYLDWYSASQQITVLDPVVAFDDGDSEGLSYTPQMAPIEITLPPIVAKPGEEIWIQEIYIDGDWITCAEAGYETA